MAYLVSGGELGWTDLELSPQWSTSAFDGFVGDIALLPSGEIVTIEQHSWGDGTDRMRTFAADGTPVSDEVVVAGRFADDQPLVKIEDLDDFSSRLIGLGGTSALDVVFSSYPPQVTHGNGVAAVTSNDLYELVLVQLDADGKELRRLARPPLAQDIVSPLDVVIAPDGAVYVCGHELDHTEMGAPDDYGFILKLPPP